MPDDDAKAIGALGRQEILTGLIVAVLAMIPISAAVTLGFVYSNPEIIDKIEVIGTVDVGKFVDKVVESYDAFLILLGVGIGSGAVATGAAIARKSDKNNNSPDDDLDITDVPNEVPPGKN